MRVKVSEYSPGTVPRYSWTLYNDLCKQVGTGTAATIEAALGAAWLVARDLRAAEQQAYPLITWWTV